MIGLEDIKEQVQERLKDTWIKIQESSTFISLKERYDNLTHSGQKTFKTGSLFIGISFLSWILWGLFSQSSEKLAEFEDYQDSIKQLLLLRRDMGFYSSHHASSKSTYIGTKSSYNSSIFPISILSKSMMYQ